MKKILLFPFLTVWVILAIAGGYAVYLLVDNIFLHRYEEYRFLCFGFGAYIVSLPIIRPNKYDFWNILIHELSHAIFALLTFAKPEQLFVNAHASEGQAGFTRYSYKSGLMGFVQSHLVSLAPYFSLS